MTGAIDRTVIKIEVKDDIDLECYPPVNEFLQRIAEALTGEAEGSFGDVVISGREPGVEDNGKLWIEPNSARKDFVPRLFINGAWRAYWFLPPSSYVVFDGRAALPDGFREIFRVKTEDLKAETTTQNNTFPSVLIFASFVGY